MDKVNLNVVSMPFIPSILPNSVFHIKTNASMCNLKTDNN